MNALAQAVDGKAGAANGIATLGADGKVPAGQLNVAAPADASTTTKGIVQLNDATNSTSTTQAATANAVKQVNDAVTTHAADYVKHPGFAGASGTTGLTVTLNPAPTAYVDGMALAIKIANTSTGATSLNVNGLGAKTIKKANGNDITSGYLKAGSIYTVRYNATTGFFILQGEGGEYGTAGAGDVRSTKNIGTDTGLVTGTLVTQSATAQTITPGTTDIVKAAGIYDGAITVQGDPDLIAGNILSGINIFGVLGNLQAKYSASGSAKSSGLYYSNGGNYNAITITGLSFAPSVVFAYCLIGSDLSFGFICSGKQINGVATQSSGNGERPATSSPTLYADGFRVLVSGNTSTQDTTNTYSWIAIK
ncbi:phage tail protein [Paenibacillus sp. SN-8-1]|uniref:phage tail protein n=1 Tax=Paenibacillus sp. SN-8-1 TaxID=3435409 RepID=UPI003D9A8963